MTNPRPTLGDRIRARRAERLTAQAPAKPATQQTSIQPEQVSLPDVGDGS